MSSSRGLSNPVIKSASLTSLALAGEFLTTSTTWEAHIYTNTHTHTQRYIHICIYVNVSMCLCFWGVYSYKKGLSVISLSAETCTGAAGGGEAGAVCLPPLLLRLAPALIPCDLMTQEGPLVWHPGRVMQQRPGHWHKEHLVVKDESRSQESGTWVSGPSVGQHQTDFNQPGGDTLMNS